MATSTTSLPGFVQPYAQGYLQRAQQVADSPFQAYEGQRVAGFNPLQTQAIQGVADRAGAPSQVMGAANAGLTNMIQGQGPTSAANPYAGPNPYLQTQIDQAQGDLVNQWNRVQAPQFDTQMARSGSFGNSGVAQSAGFAVDALQRNLGNVSADMRFRDYAMQGQLGESAAGRADSMASGNQSRILAALGLAPQMEQAGYAGLDRLMGAGSAVQAQDQRQLDSDYGRFVESRDYPMRQLGVMGEALGRSYGQQTTQTGAEPNPIAQAVGGALTGAQIYKLLFGG
jgi:hypothetical protein